MSAEHVLTVESTVSCGHSGTVAVQSTAKLRVGGARVLVKNSINSRPVAQCTTVPKSDATGPVDVPCTVASAVTGGEATKLTAGGQPVMLDTVAGATNGLVAKGPQKKLAASAGQTKLRSV